MKHDTINHDLRDLLLPYEHQWVALSRDRTKVLAASDDLEHLDATVQHDDAIFMKVLPFDSPCIFSA